MAARGIRGLFFVNSGPVLSRTIPLDNTLAIARAEAGTEKVLAELGDAGFDAGQLASIRHGSVGNLTMAETAKAEAVLLDLLETDFETLHRDLDLFLRPDDLRALESRGIEIGNHTASHTRCNLLSPAELTTEIVEAKAQLDAMTAAPVRSFAFPWGWEDDATPAALETIRSCGHEAIFLMHARSNRWRPARDVYYRSLMLDQTGLQLSASLSVTPFLRSVKSGAIFGSRKLPEPGPAA